MRGSACPVRVGGWASGRAAPAAALARLRLVLRSARASTGQLATALVWGLGLCVGLEGRAVGLPRNRPRRWICRLPSAVQVADPPPSGSGAAEVLPSRGPCHEKGEALPTPPPRAATILPPCARGPTLLPSRRDPGANAEAFDLRRTNAEDCVHSGSRSPRTRAADRPAARSRLFRRPFPAGAAAAHQHDETLAGSAPATQTPCGSAPAGRGAHMPTTPVHPVTAEADPRRRG